MRGRRDVGEVELRDLADGLEDVAQLQLEPRDLVLGELEARERRHVQYVIPRDRHRVSSYQNKEAPFRGPLTTVPKGKLDRLDVRGLSALGALHDLELNTLTLRQRLVTLLGNRREVDEDILAALTLDEPIALLVREPLHGALSQHFLLQNTRRPGHRAATTNTAAGV